MIDNPSNRRLFLISALAFFLELLLIKWLPSHARLLAYFANVLFIACFAGLSVGSLAATRKTAFIRFWSLTILGTLLLAIGARYLQVVPVNDDILLQDFRRGHIDVHIYTLLTLFFAATLIAFVPAGQEIGRLLRDGPTLERYIAHLGGSLAGICTMVVFSSGSLPPWFGFALIGVGIAFVNHARRSDLALAAIPLAVVAGMVYWVDRDSDWSPYHRVTISPLLFDREQNEIVQKFERPEGTPVALEASVGFNVSVNDDYLQMALDLSDASVDARGYLERWRALYDRPYEIRSPRSVLIVGGGAGNDAAAALRHTVQRVDVVDIEPLVLSMGYSLHPEKPYAHPAVTTHVEDARIFFHQTNQRYEAVIFGLPDSHRLFAQLSSVRLDSYLYTIEGLRAAYALLKDDGMLYVHNAATNSHVGPRLYHMLAHVCENEPVSIASPISPAILCTRDPSSVDLEGQIPGGIPVDYSEYQMATDNWPFFYLKQAAIPFEYRVSLFAMIVLTVLSISLAPPGKRALKLTRSDVFFFLLGIGFLLLQTRGITSLGILFGSTWIVNALVLAAMTLAGIASAVVASRSRIRPGLLPYALLGFFLIGLYLIHPAQIAHWSWPFRALTGLALVGVPLFLSGIIFATAFASSENAARDFAFNVAGAVFGGFIEYGAMVIGFDLMIVVLGFAYFLAFLVRARAKPQER